MTGHRCGNCLSVFAPSKAQPGDATVAVDVAVPVRGDDGDGTFEQPRMNLCGLCRPHVDPGVLRAAEIVSRRIKARGKR